tara:strand:+ start:177 stop:1307 length:1131 start_codon:yes stop_codon:yes gene_type:complete
MKKIFILTGEPSGDKLAAKVISNLMKINSNIEFLSVGGENLKSLGIRSIYDLSEITYLGFTKVLLNLFTINSKINKTVESVLRFNPDILFTVDSPDFTLRVAEKVKQKNSNIKTIHYVAPQVWVWREGRVKKIKKFIDHIFLLFNFEKKYFEKEGVSCEFVGHPLLDNKKTTKIDINQIIEKNKALISLFPGSRVSEVELLMPILLNFIKLMKKNYNDITYVFHSTKELSLILQSYIDKEKMSNCEIIIDEKIKEHIMSKSIFAVSKSGTISLEICNAQVPSVIIYKMGFINYLIIKMLVKTKFANIINIAANEEIIPELIQSNCNAINIYEQTKELLEDPEKIKNQIIKTKKILETFKTSKNSTDIASLSLNKFL